MEIHVEGSGYPSKELFFGLIADTLVRSRCLASTPANKQAWQSWSYATKGQGLFHKVLKHAGVLRG